MLLQTVDKKRLAEYWSNIPSVNKSIHEKDYIKKDNKAQDKEQVENV